MMETDNEAKLLNQDSIQSDRFKRSCENYIVSYETVYIFKEYIADE